MALEHCKHGYFDAAPDVSGVGQALRHYGEWAEVQLDVLLRYLAPAATVVEIGAGLGAHTVPLARAVTNAGKVFAYEADLNAQARLRTSLTANHLDQWVELAVWDHDITLDSLALSSLRLLIIAQASGVLALLRGAAHTIAQYLPVIALTRAVAEDAGGVLEWAKQNGYRVFGHTSPAFNPDNFRRASDNLFGMQRDGVVILIADREVPYADVEGLQSIDSLATLTALFETAHGSDAEMRMSPRTAFASSRLDSAGVAAARGVCGANAVHIVVPFYKKEELVAPLFASLNAITDELREIGAQVYFYNDSPDYAPLQAELDRCRFDDNAIQLKILRNEANLGFIGTCNQAFALAKTERADVILLNSDTLMFPGSLREVLRVSRLDPMIGIVSPRSNNATLATLPHSSYETYVAPEQGYADFVRCANTLPPYSYVPTAVGYCFLVKWAVHSELGGFDPIYGLGYNEENDLVMRANRCGYRAVLANHAFVWHQGEQSFAESAKTKAAREAKNAPILQARYPEYWALVQRYFVSPEYRAECLLEHAQARNGDVTVAFDFSSFGAYFNGTFECGIHILAAAVRIWPAHCKIVVIMDLAAWEFHGLERFERIVRCDVHDGAFRASAILRIGQPFGVDVLTRSVARAPVIGTFMLDTIAYDCGYLAQDFDHRVWRFVFEHTDVVFSNSRYTLDRIISRFKFGERVLRRVSRHSLDVSEFAHASERAPGTRQHLFVIGNHFDHKYVRPTADALAAAFPDQRIVAVGYGKAQAAFPNIDVYESGNVPQETFERFYTDALAVVFPSHYEGFGFPIVHALARERPIFARDSSLFRELAPSIKGTENIRYFCNSDDLIAALRSHDATWVTPQSEGERHGWDRSARETWHALEQARRTVSYDALVERLRVLDTLAQSRDETANFLSAGRIVGRRVEAMVDRMLRIRMVLMVARTGWRGLRRLRRLRRR